MNKTLHFALIGAIILFGVSFNPVATQASDSNISFVTVDDISNAAPSVQADYTLTFDVAFGATWIYIRVYPIADDGTVGDSTLSGFNFASTTITSDSLPSGTTVTLSAGTELMITLNSTVSTGTYSITLHDVQNSATEGNYKIGMASMVTTTDDDFTKSDAFSIITDPCSTITTVELTDVAASSFGTNASVTRGESDTAATSYLLAYATSQTDIDNDTASTVDMTTITETIVEDLTAQTLYYFQVSALDANNCVLARTSVSATTERAITDRRYTKPTVNKITKRTAVAHWIADDFVDTYDVQLWSKTKLLKRFNNLTTLKKTLTKKYLQSGKTYKVRVRADYTTEETTRWSKFKKFTTQ
ncbi:MAG: hypothetical protein HY565_00750 [Candidatus Kerfeldbacteria bacterium]|nr:hypothetical protein [Candidatus Kerfeldbacteria bacterium]